MTSQNKVISLQPAARDVPTLASGFCLERQQRLLHLLAGRDITTALILDRRHVHYFTGFWARSAFAPALLLQQHQRATLALPYAQTNSAADVVTYPASRHGTMTDAGIGAAIDVLIRDVDPSLALASDVAISARPTVAITDDLFAMRRSKWPDEIALLRHGIFAAEAGYAYAANAINAGLSEFDLYAGLLSVITQAAGEPVGEMGNDFQSGSPGGPPRNRAMEAGELLPLDLGVSVRGYTADLCRTFAVGRQPTADQSAAHAHVMDVLAVLENQCQPGASCQALYKKCDQRLSGFNGAAFGHHLGHGTGLSPHEAPRLNPHWYDMLAVGDVFTLEPGLYHPDLRAGVRVEQMYLVTESGVLRLSQFPTGLVHG